MEDIVNSYLNSKNELMLFFDCNDDYFIRYMQNYDWRIYDNEGLYFLNYWNDNTKIDSIIVRKKNNPLIYEKEDYTMVIAIDCVKIAFILKNENRKYT